MNVVVTCSTGDQGLSLACCHDRDPSRLCCSPTRLEVLQHSNMMHLDLLVRTAHGIVNLMNFVDVLSLLTSYLNVKKAEIATRKRAESPLLSDFHLD